MDRPLISVIIPSHNSAKTQERCAKSLAMQSFSDFEVIVVDDNSTDGSYEKWAELSASDSRFRLFVNSQKGVASARNEGIKQALGRYIAFCDADDAYDENQLSILLDNIGEGALAICGVRVETENGGYDRKAPLCGVFEGENKKAIINEFYDIYFMGVWNKLFDMALIKEHNIVFPNLSSAEDVSFVLDYLYYCNRIVCFEKPCYRYIQRTNSLTKGYNGDMLCGKEKTSEKLLKLCRQWGGDTEKTKDYCLLSLAGTICAYVQAVMLEKTLTGTQKKEIYRECTKKEAFSCVKKFRGITNRIIASKNFRIVTLYFSLYGRLK